MAVAKLSEALRAVNWNENIDTLLGDDDLSNRIDQSCQRIAIWARQLENIDAKNPAISFVRALQISAHHAVATMGLAIYKASAASIRGVVENALYYTYFRTHPVELASLVRDEAYYVSKGEILTYHKLHTSEFKTLQEKFGLISRIEAWYSNISAIVHGQVPGVWVEQRGLADTKPNIATLRLVVEEFCNAEKIVHDFFLLTVGRENWDDFSHLAKKSLISGMSGDQRAALLLDKH